MFQEYPKWIETDGAGDDSYPGHILVENAEEEAALLGAAPEPVKRGRPKKTHA